ncbi:MAG: Wzy polymerase domain-containing protein [Pseudomonadota bacterium]
MPPPNPDHAPFIDSFPGLIQPPGSVYRKRLMQVLVMAALVLPWVMPFAGNPSPAVWPWLTAAFGSGVLLVLLGWGRALALTPEMVRRGWMAAAAISAAMGAVQYFGSSEHFSPWLNQTRPGEAFGNLRQRNQFASLMGIGLVALIWRQGYRAGKYLPLLLVLLALGNAASSSRTGALQWLAILAVALVYSGRGRRGAGLTALFAFGVYLLWVLILPWLLVVLTGAHAGGLVARFEETPGCASRLVLWSNVLTLIGERPWLGWGWGELDYAHYMTLYPGERFCDILDNAHNLPLHLAVELGVPFAATLCAGLSWLVWRARPWRETDASRQMVWAVLALIGLHSLLEYPLWYGPFQMAAGLCVYLLWTTRAGGGHGPDVPWPGDTLAGVARHGVAVAGLVILAAVAYAAWDYHRVSQIYLGAAQRHPAYRDNTLAKVSATRLFRRQAEFAALSLTPLTPANALQIHAQSSELLHFSPEPRVIEKLIESAVMLGRDEEALLHLARYRAAFPQNHALWRDALGVAEGTAD